MLTIANRRHPLVARFRQAARADGGMLLLDGVHLVQAATELGLHLRHVVVSAAALEQRDIGRILDALSGRQAEIAVAGAGIMDAISPVRSPSVIAALADPPATSADAPYRDTTPLVLIAIDVQDPGNLGAIARVAEAAGATGLVAAGTSADPFSWKALRGSMGSALRLPIVVARDAVQAVADARQRGCRIVATVARGGETHVDADFSRSVALLIGGEGAGLPEALVSSADARVSIPMRPPVESLNVAVAAAVLAYEACRQRAAVEPLSPARTSR
jgi:TrmH family RNA methyltransferase